MKELRKLILCDAIGIDPAYLVDGVYHGSLNQRLVKGNPTLKYKFLDIIQSLEINKVSGDFYVPNGKYPDLTGCPEYIGGLFYCEYCGLQSLKGGPIEVGRDYLCGNNNLTSLHGIAQYIGGSLHTKNNIVELSYMGTKGSEIITVVRGRNYF